MGKLGELKYYSMFLALHGKTHKEAVLEIYFRFFEPCVSAKRGLRETIDKLKTAGHLVVPFKPPTDGWFQYRVYVSCVFCFQFGLSDFNLPLLTAST